MKSFVLTLLLAVAVCIAFLLISSGLFNGPEVALPTAVLGPGATSSSNTPSSSSSAPRAGNSSSSWQPVFHGPSTPPHINGPSGPPPHYNP